MHVERREAILGFLFYLGALAVLWGAKTMAAWGIAGSAASALAAFYQLQIPLWRLERRGHLWAGYEGAWAGAVWLPELAEAAAWAGLVLPLWALGYHAWMGAAGWAPHLPHAGSEWLGAMAWGLERGVIHTLGVALPEEVFYRGYLQPAWQAVWPAQGGMGGSALGIAAVAATAAFSVGHVIGEWQLARFGPFFPGLLFAWQRNRRGALVGATGLHAACNLFAEVWATQYAIAH